MTGYNALWVPGTDHASIATEAKVVQKLAKQGIKKSDLSRTSLLKHVWDWTHEHGGIIISQLKKIGASCDWDREVFTMDEPRAKGGDRCLCDLYRKGHLSRRADGQLGQARTAISDEVIHKVSWQALLRPLLRGGMPDKYIIVATTRPETITRRYGGLHQPHRRAVPLAQGKR